MKAIELKGLDQTLYYEKLENGLEVYMLPYKNKSNYTMHYLTKYGSIQTTFIPYGEKEKITVPDGIAHFLEHKMFEQEDGVDPFTYAAKTGTYSNASTNFECTRYYFEGNQAFQDNLNYLLDFVGSPYFTDENVEKEKGIIAEEIKQYDDEVEWVFEEEMKKALLQKDNHRVDIAGTIESINTITKEDLYNTYYTFYQPSNMFLVISGDFKVEDAINTIKNNETLRNAKTNFKVKVFQEEEPLAVNEKIKELEFNVVNTKVGYGIKIPIKHITDKYLFNLYIGLMLSIKFGLSSVFREKLKKEQLEAYLKICEMLKGLPPMYVMHPVGYRLKSQAIAMEVFFELLNHFATREEHVQTSERNTILERLGEITEYIELHYKEQISLEEIASHFYLSREYFSRFFKQNMGVNFLRYVNQVRLMHIYQDICNTQKGILEIAEENGFTNYKLFNRMFHEIYGCSPRDVRKK